MASGLHGYIGAKLAHYLLSHVDDQELGHVFDSSVTYDFNDGLPKREPDVSFILSEKMDAPTDEDITIAPDIAVEVVSKNDKWFDVRRKIQQYQQSGVKLVWILTSVDKTVDVYRLENGLRSESLLVDDVLDGGSVLPGFRVPVRRLFPK